MIPNTWEWVRLRSITSILGDGIHGTPEYDERGEYYFINGNNLKDKAIIIKPDTKKVNEKEYQKYKKDLGENTILVSINGTLGNVAYYNNEPVMLGKSACYFNLMSNDLKDYIYIVLNSPFFLEYALSAATGTTIKNVSLQAMNNLLVPFPSLPEQNRILNKIELLKVSLDRYYKQEKQLSKLNNSIRQTLKKSVLQEAIQGKLVPQDASEEPATILLQHIREEKLRLVKEGKLKKKDVIDSTIFRGDDNRYFEKIGKEVVDITSDIPFEIPNGWVWCRIGQIAEFVNGLAFKPSEWENKGLPIIRIQNLTDNNRPYNYTTKIFEDKYKIRKDDLLFSWSATLDSFIWEREDAWLNQHIFKVIPYKCIDKRFLYYSFKVLVYSFSNITHGLTMKHLTRGVFENHLFALPPLKEQKRIVAKIDEALAGIMSR